MMLCQKELVAVLHPAVIGPPVCSSKILSEESTFFFSVMLGRKQELKFQSKSMQHMKVYMVALLLQAVLCIL